MANKFKVWVDSPGSVIMDATTFATDTQRSGGFQAGQAASALRVNSALRQANLVITALMGLVDNSNLDLKSSVTDVSQGINTWLTNKITNTTVTNASNVSSKINNKNLTEIFESDGTTVKNATTSVNANITSDLTVEDNVIKFAIGTGVGYNKTITPLNGYDNSKGTIEERLTSLGFNEGDATNLNSSYITRCHYYQEGNSTFFNIDIRWPDTTATAGNDPVYTQIAEFPSSFRNSGMEEKTLALVLHSNKKSSGASRYYYTRLRYYLKVDTVTNNTTLYVSSKNIGPAGSTDTLPSSFEQNVISSVIYSPDNLQSSMNVYPQIIKISN